MGSLVNCIKNLGKQYHELYRNVQKKEEGTFLNSFNGASTLPETEMRKSHYNNIFLLNKDTTFLNKSRVSSSLLPSLWSLGPIFLVGEDGQESDLRSCGPPSAEHAPQRLIFSRATSYSEALWPLYLPIWIIKHFTCI